ncbi:MAG: hypothetical protein KAV87_51685 [Desulfobacteraceae bacterium]|nr:hypothetical protein [Desulfobacteraceae bacterium]
MEITNREIVEACVPILQNSRHEDPNEMCFLTSYQIWLILREQRPDIRERIEADEGTALGRGGGSHRGPAKRIGDALSRSDEIETRYFDTRHIIFRSNGEEFAASGPSCGLFRLR